MIAVLAAVASITVNYKIKEIIDAIASGTQFNNTVFLLWSFVGYKLLHHGMFFLYRLMEIRYKPQILLEVIENAYKKVAAQSLHWFDSHLSGDIVSKITNFQESTVHLISFCFRAINHISTIVISIVFLFFINHTTAYIIVVFVLIYSPIIGLMLRRQMVLQKEYTLAKQHAVGLINDSITNMFSVKVIGTLKTELKNTLYPAFSQWRSKDVNARKFDAYFVDMPDTIMVVIMGAVQIYYLAYFYQIGQISAGDFTFIAMITLNIHYDLDAFLENILFNINPALATMKASFSFINQEIEVQNSRNAISINSIKGDITFKDVCFRYNDSQKDVLCNLNLHIPIGQKIGIVGYSGAGKTTFVKCLLRYFDVKSGSIMIDNVDIRNITQESMRSHISIVPQDISMFHRTILENLQIVAPNASFDQIQKACIDASIHDDILKMSNGYNSVVGERGIKLSGGQRQRIAIARAILKNAPILIFDESTSSLDAPTEIIIHNTMKQLFATNNVTTMVIAHRFATLVNMDRIIVIDRGHIVQDGMHQTLINESGLYQKLWSSQVNGVLCDTIKPV